MVYIRTKKVKDDKYLYLVKSVWDSKRATSKQEIVKYLGKASQVSFDDIPIDYREDPKIQSFLSTHSGKNIEKIKKMNKKLEEKLFNSLTKGDLDNALDIYESYIKYSNLHNFFENILKPVMYKVGEQWASGKLSIATEHVASNIARELVSIINEKTSKIDHKGKVLLCTPTGEEHALGCNIIQTFLQNKGFQVLNLAPSAPAEAILHFIDKEKPNAILVSVTIEDNIKTAQRLINKINDNSNVPVLIGGQAINNTKSNFNATIAENESLDKIPKLIKQIVK
jgi:methanogenic corrinoid protein MtbC1